MLRSPGAAASTEALWALPPEALSITTPSSLGMTFEAGPQILFPNLKAWTFWRLITLFFPPSCTIYQTTKNWNRYETELPVKTSPLSPKGIRDIFLWTAKTLQSTVIVPVLKIKAVDQEVLNQEEEALAELITETLL